MSIRVDGESCSIEGITDGCLIVDIQGLDNITRETLESLIKNVSETELINYDYIIVVSQSSDEVLFLKNKSGKKGVYSFVGMGLGKNENKKGSSKFDLLDFE